MAKNAIDSRTKGRKIKVLNRPIDFTCINKVPILEKCPMDKSSLLKITYKSLNKKKHVGPHSPTIGATSMVRCPKRNDLTGILELVFALTQSI